MKAKIPVTVPNILTTVRLAAIPFMAWFIYYSEKSNSTKMRMIAFSFFITIWITDLVDGFIARRFDQVSEFGKIYDPFVDKVFQFTTALMMLIIKRIPAWVVVFMLVKEVLMILGGAYLLQKRNQVVYSKWYGKAATALFVAALASMFFLPEDLARIKSYIFILPVLSAVFSLLAYGKESFIGGEPIRTLIHSKPVSPDDREDAKVAGQEGEP